MAIPMTMTCSDCGSANVSCDALARWDTGQQQWAMSNAFPEDAYCHACESTTTLNSEEYDPEAFQ